MSGWLCKGWGVGGVKRAQQPGTGRPRQPETQAGAGDAVSTGSSYSLHPVLFSIHAHLCRLQKERREADMRAAEERGKAAAELELLRSEAATAEARLAAAREDVRRVETELRDYKSRAHALLKAKETELKTARDVAREESVAALAETEVRAARAEEQARQAAEELSQLRQRSAAELATLSQQYEGQLRELRQAAGQASDAAEAAKR